MVLPRDIAGYPCDPPPSQPRWPAEWEPHAATWVSWPRNSDTWPHNLPVAQREHAAFVRIIAEHEPVFVLAGGDAMSTAQDLLGDCANVECVDVPTNDAWMRDHGATFVLDAQGCLTAIDWIFNAWGGKYPPFDRDQAVATRMAERLACEIVHCGMVMEGGALETDGQGRLLTTESCALDPIRNPQMTREKFEEVMSQLLGIRETIWLPGEAIIGDDTDGHIDQIARFIDPQRVVVSVCANSSDANAPLQQANWDTLVQWNDEQDQPLELIELPSPGVIELFATRLPASYCNFYVANGLVLVPSFDDPADDRALQILRDLFPQHRVISSPSRNLLWGLGSFHCLTQQQPSVRAGDGA